MKNIGLLIMLIFEMCTIKSNAQFTPYFDYNLHKWIDSFNIQHQCENYLYYDPYQRTPPKWNKELKKYNTSFSNLLTYNAIVKTKYRKVKIKAFPLENPYHYNSTDLAFNLNGDIYSVMDSIIKDKTATKTIELEYDKEGRLLTRKTNNLPYDTTAISIDSLEIQYSKDEHKNEVINFHSGSYSYNAILWTSSSYCGKISGEDTPITTRGEGNAKFIFNTLGLLISQTSTYETYYNNCHAYFPNTSKNDYTYDEKGRMTLTLDSSLTQHKLMSQSIKKYTDETLDTGNKIYKNYLLAKWLKQYKNPYQSTIELKNFNYKKDTGRGFYIIDTPTQKYTNSEQIIFNNEGSVILTYPARYANISVHQSGADSLGVFSGIYDVYFNENSTDTAEYDPSIKRESVTERHGCIVETYEKKPQGTLPMISNKFYYRNNYFFKNNACLINYGYGGQGSEGRKFWASKPYRYGKSSNANFVIINKEKLVKYFYKNQTLYVLTYE